MREFSNQNILQAALQDSDYSNILITAPSGAGKTFLIESCYQRQHNNKGDFRVFNHTIIHSTDQIVLFMGQALNDGVDLIVFDNIENLGHNSQFCLLIYLDIHKREYPKQQLIFTSSRAVGELRDYRTTLLQGLYDRISEILIVLPALADLPNTIDEFEKVWKTINTDMKIPKVLELHTWLYKRAILMKGNYRDLEKIAYRWQIYRTILPDDTLIFDKIKREFADFGYNIQVYQKNGYFSYSLEDGLDILEKNFRHQVCQEARKLHPTQKVAADALKISLKTINRILSGE